MILSGSHASVYEVDDKAPDAVYELGLPVLGICYGMQLLAHRLGGRVARSTRHEYGPAALVVDEAEHPLFAGWTAADGRAEQVWMSHGDKVEAGHTREFGYAEVRARGHTALLKGIEDFHTPEGHGMLKVWMSHGDKVTELPPGFKLMASTDSCPIAGMADEQRRFYAVQFLSLIHISEPTRPY